MEERKVELSELKKELLAEILTLTDEECDLVLKRYKEIKSEKSA